MRATLKLADRLLLQKVRTRFGGRLRVAVSGAAPLGKDLALFYEVIGMPLIEGYGLTEGGVATLNPIDRPKAGSIGKVLPGVEVRLAEDGELLLRSPSLLSGYYKDPEGTAEVLRGGWLHTGDIAEIDDEGYIYITSRKKEVIISSSGKNVYPARIEALFKMEPLVNTVVLVGDRLPYVSALFTINPAAAEALKGMSDCSDRSSAGIATAGPVLAELRKAVARVNRQLAPFEQIRKFGILNRELSIERGELTATSKIRRGVVLENYRDRIAELYAGKEESH
jgi:long-chain acyl-CoA synthetase